MFIDIQKMPIEFEHLRTRLRIEQSRCLHWGQKVGLVEEMLDEPSKLLQLNHNIVLDILLEIQRSFRSCLAITSKYDPHLPARSPMRPNAVPVTDSNKPTLLQKTLAVWERSGRLAGRIEWSMVKRDSFEKLIARLIQYNDRIESFLDRNALEDVRAMQAQSNLMLLQMTVKVDKLHNLIEALQVSTELDVDAQSTFSRSSTLVESTDGDTQSVVSLAAFKAHYLKIEMSSEPSNLLSIAFDTMGCDGDPRYMGRQMAMLQQQRIWLEWRETADEYLSERQYVQQIDERVKKLAAILSASDKPAAFRSPKCIGFTKAVQDGKPRYALVHEGLVGPDGGEAELVSLRGMLGRKTSAPSLNARIELAGILAASVLYLHAVDWVHKDIRSDSILFMRESNHALRLYKPIIAGFEFSRPALQEEVTVTQDYSPQQALYRHPDLLTRNADRSKKSHDIYSFGLLLAEIGLWQPIEDIVDIEVRRHKAVQVRERMLDNRHYGVISFITERAGRAFSEIVMSCIDGSLTLRDQEGHECDEEDPSIGADMARLFYEKVVMKLKGIRV